MTLAQRELLRQARLVLEALDRSGPRLEYNHAPRLRAAVLAVEAEDAAALPSIDVPALLRRQAE